MENNNSDIYIKLSALPDKLKAEVVDFIEFLQNKCVLNKVKKDKREAGLAKGLIKMKNDFD